MTSQLPPPPPRKINECNKNKFCNWIPETAVLESQITDTQKAIQGCNETIEEIQQSINEFEIEMAQLDLYLFNAKESGTFESLFKTNAPQKSPLTLAKIKKLFSKTRD